MGKRKGNIEGSGILVVGVECFVPVAGVECFLLIAGVLVAGVGEAFLDCGFVFLVWDNQP